MSTPQNSIKLAIGGTCEDEVPDFVQAHHEFATVVQESIEKIRSDFEIKTLAIRDESRLVLGRIQRQEDTFKLFVAQL